MNLSVRIMNINTERGSVTGWLIGILAFIAVCIGGYLMAVNLGYVKVPESLAQISVIKAVMPKVNEPPVTEVVTISNEESLKQQIIILNSKIVAAEAKIETLEAQLAEKESLITTRNDEIASLRNALKMTQGQNISAVAGIYESMDPLEASVILASLTPEEASLIIGAMKESKAAGIMELLDKNFATRITSILAGFEESTLIPPADTSGTSGISTPSPSGTAGLN